MRGAVVAAVVSFVIISLFDLLTGSYATTEGFAQRIVFPAIVSAAIGLGAFILAFTVAMLAIHKKKPP
jgi:hypothetical protein